MFEPNEMVRVAKGKAKLSLVDRERVPAAEGHPATSHPS